MGYTTKFQGMFALDHPLSEGHGAYLRKFSRTRRMKRSRVLAESVMDRERIAVGLPIGVDGGYFVGGLGICGQDVDASVTDSESPPEGQPSQFCGWLPSLGGLGIEWDGNENFDNYVEWLEYLIEHFLGPWGYVVSGEVYWRGRDWVDNGTLVVVRNRVYGRGGS